jgi:hypothetical protein
MGDWWVYVVQAVFPVMLVGLPEFARLPLLHVRPAAIEPDSLPVLHAIGDPPAVW